MTTTGMLAVFLFCQQSRYLLHFMKQERLVQITNPHFDNVKS